MKLFGMAAVGSVLSNIYNTEYIELMNNYITKDLKLENTQISNGKGNLSGYWNWESDDAYLAAGGLTSLMGMKL